MSITMIILVLLVVYTYVGYPLLLKILTENKRLDYPTKNFDGDISIVLVVHNEADSVVDKIQNIEALKFKGCDKKLIIVDDKSTDETISRIEKYNSSLVELIKSDANLGKANGLNLALSKVSTELVVFIDCRQELSSNSLNELTSWFSEDNEIGAVSGELIFRSLDNNEYSKGVDGYWKYEKWIRKNEAILNSVPGVTGAIYAMRTQLFRPLPVNTLLDDVQIPMIAAEQGKRVIFDDRALAFDVPSVSPAVEKRRKVRTLAGNYQLLFRFPQWIIPGGHPIWWQFLSHKIARLLAPIFILLMIPVGISDYLTDGLIFSALISTGIILAIFLWILSFRLSIFNKIPFFTTLSSFLSLNWYCLLSIDYYFRASNSGSWK